MVGCQKGLEAVDGHQYCAPAIVFWIGRHLGGHICCWVLGSRLALGWSPGESAEVEDTGLLASFGCFFNIDGRRGVIEKITVHLGAGQCLLLQRRPRTTEHGGPQQVCRCIVDGGGKYAFGV